MAVSMERRKDGETFHEVTYAGRVLGTRERNYYDDSDFYAVVWNDETDSVATVDYATTRFWTYNNSATVDADEATVNKYEAYLTRVNFAELESQFASRMARVERGRTVTLNRTVRSKQNGTFTKGETGTVFWMGADKYAPRWRTEAYRAGVEFSDGRKHFFSTDDLTGVADETFDAEGSREYAAAMAARSVARHRERLAKEAAVAA